MLFHEMYGAYFRIAAKVLQEEEISEQALREIVVQEGFRDSVLFVPQKLLPQKDGSDWGLLRRNASGTSRRLTKHAPEMPLTLLQKRWLPRKTLVLPGVALALLATALLLLVLKLKA